MAYIRVRPKVNKFDCNELYDAVYKAFFGFIENPSIPNKIKHDYIYYLLYYKGYRGNVTFEVINNERWIFKLNILVERRGSDYTKWRNKVLDRDNHTCVECGSKEHLCAHHIKSWVNFKHLRVELSNGKTLCNECHARTHNYGLGTRTERLIYANEIYNEPKITEIQEEQTLRNEHVECSKSCGVL